MNGWEALTTLGTFLFWIWIGVFLWAFFWVLIKHIHHTLLQRTRAAKAWQEGYDQGVHDERQAAAVDIPEYRIPKRQNPYGESAKN